jgi:hypothetical protein
MCEIETDISDIEAFVQLLGRVRIPLEALYRDEIKRMEEEADAFDRGEDQTSYRVM